GARRHFERKEMTPSNQTEAKQTPGIAETYAPQDVRVAAADEAAGNGEALETARDVVRNGAVNLIFDPRIEPERDAVVGLDQPIPGVVLQRFGREVMKQGAPFEVRDGLLARCPFTTPMQRRPGRRYAIDQTHAFHEFYRTALKRRQNRRVEQDHRLE